MQLSQHFKLSEFTRSDNAKRLGIDNSPTPEHLENLKRLAAAAEVLRELFGVAITPSSGYRSPKLNAATPGSSPTSDHSQGLAFDFLPRGCTVAQAVAKIRASGIKFDQLIDEPTWVHFGIGARMRQQVLIARRMGPKGVMVYSPA